MLAPQTCLGARSSYNNSSNNGRMAPPLGGKLKELSDKVSQLSSENVPLELTFGLEMEFILLGTPPPVSPPRGNLHYPAQLAIYDALKQPMSAECADCGELHWFKLPVTAPDEMPGSFDRDAWSIDRDPSIFLSTIENDKFTENLRTNPERMVPAVWGLELKSRVFTKGKNLPTTDSLTDSRHRHEITTEQEITLMLEKLHQTFNGSQGLSLAMNSSCGLHVHVGNGVMSRGFPLSTVKNIFSVYTANERAIDSVMSCDRIGGSKYAIMPLDERPGAMHSSLPGPHTYNIPNSDFFIASAFNLLHYNSRGKPTGPTPIYPARDLHIPAVARSAYSFMPCDWLNIIQNAQSIYDLRGIHCGWEHHNTLNFQNLEETRSYGRDYGRGKVTVEFRQHPGTLEAIDVVAWADFVTSIVDFSHASSSAEMRSHLDKALTDPNYGTLPLLKDIGCKDSTIAHYKHVLGQTGTQDYASGRRDKQLQDAAQVQDVASNLRQTLIDSQAAALSSTAIKDKISMKFKFGGYGRFTPTYLDKYEPALAAADKQRLTAGTAIAKPPRVIDICGAYDPGSDDELDNEEDCGLALTPSPQMEILVPAIFGESYQRFGGSDQRVGASGYLFGAPDQRPSTTMADCIQQARNARLAQAAGTSPPTDFGFSSSERPNGPSNLQVQDTPASQPAAKPRLGAADAQLEAELPDMPEESYRTQLGPPIVAMPINPSRPQSVMSRRGRFVANIDLMATERMTQRARAGREAVRVLLEDS